MPCALPTLLPLFLQAITVTPQTAPAAGRQEAIIQLDRATMVRVSARSAGGTACEVVDHVRGPFASSGQAGETNCQLDLLLDAGTYKLRLEGRAKAKGQVEIKATPFAEVNSPIVRLEPRRAMETTVHPGQQASYWLRLDKRQAVNLRISGRTVGQVKLWRDGEWLENYPLRATTQSPLSGQPVHEWWLQAVLDEGDYLLTAYGADPLSWTGGKEADFVSIEHGFRQGPVERGLEVTLPAWGMVALELPAGPVTAFASLEKSLATATELSIHGVSAEGVSAIGAGPDGSCRIEPRALVPECVVSGSVSRTRVLVLRGAPGTRAHVEWGSHVSSGPWSDGAYGRPASTIEFQATASAAHVIGVHDLPPDDDAAPLSCQLAEVQPKNLGLTPVGRDVLSVDGEHPFERELNYDGSSAVVWFDIKRTDRYRVATGAERKSGCELYKVETDGTRKRLTETQAGNCNVVQTLAQGSYELALHGGTEGVEKLSIRADGGRSVKPSPTKSSCLILGSDLKAGSTYRLSLTRGGKMAARGLVLAQLPLVLAQPLHLIVDAQKTIQLPVTAGATIVARSVGGQPFGCGLKSGALAEATEGSCRLEARSADSIVLRNGSDASLSVTLYRPSTLPPTPAPVAYQPRPRPLRQVPLDALTFFDFERGQSHSMTFEVQKAGLYHVTTQGLLATECRIRTPVVPEVAQNRSGGRGRNCLVAGYLRPGRYMLTVNTVNASKGRGAVLMTRRAPQEARAVAADGESFFRASASDLLQQRLTVKSSGRYELSTTGQGVSLECRLDDKEGWPVVKVPTSCASTLDLKAGQYLWTQLPLTVESMRRTQLRRARAPVQLTGNKPHPIAFHTWYSATLGDDGKDEFLFTLEGELELQIAMSSGMQGRIYLLEPNKKPKVVGVVPPQDSAPTQDDSGTEGESDESESRGTDSEGGEGDGESEDEGDSRPGNAYQPLIARPAPPPPAGHKVTLPPGQYKLVTEHSRADVAVQYRLFLGSATMMPGMARDLPVPSRVLVKMPQNGTLRVRTEGEADVRCRLFDSSGRRVFEGSENGDDWNCALAEPLAKGDYELVLESETQAPGLTRLLLGMPRREEAGPVVDGASLRVVANVLALEVPVPEKDSVQDISLRARTPFSCAVEDAKGQVVYRLSRVKDCGVLIRPGAEKFRIRLWTTDGGASVTTSFLSRPIHELSGGVIPQKQAALGKVGRAGRYATSGQVFCLPGATLGVLRDCQGEASLEAGPVVLSTRGDTLQAKVPLTEQVVQLDAAGLAERKGLTRVPFLQSSAAAGPAIHLLAASVSHGERVAPSCAIDSYWTGSKIGGPGGVREGRESQCFAASGIATSAIHRLWAPSDEAINAEVHRRAVPLPKESIQLAAGRRILTWTGPAVVYQLPSSGPSRVELTVARDAWVVALDGEGRAVDFCAPKPELARCIFGSRGGRLFIYSPSEQKADATVLLMDAPARTVAFTGLYEETPRTPGSLRLRVPPADSDRIAQVEGHASCVVALDDGVRISGCKASVPARIGAELVIEYLPGPLRAVVHVNGRDRWARLGIELPAATGQPLQEAVAIKPSGPVTDRSFTLATESMVRLKAESGVCGLFKGNDLLATAGMDSGCEINRLLAAGTYRWVLRPFAKVPLLGTMSWTAEPVAVLSDGVGPEEWISPSELRLYRFATASEGKIGLGVQVKAESLDCRIFDEANILLGEGCQQYLALEKGSYLLAVSAPPSPGARPLRYRPVLVGLAGSRAGVPDEYLKDFFRRIGAEQ